MLNVAFDRHVDGAVRQRSIESIGIEEDGENETSTLARRFGRAFTPITSTQAAAVERLSLASEGALVTLGSAQYPDSDPWWKRIAPTTYFVLGAGGIALLFLLHELIVAGKLGFPVDEAWVHLVYARNFFHHIAFEFNPGDRVPGPAGPFWTVFLAFGGALFRDPILAAKLLGSIFLFLTGYYSYRILRSLEYDQASAILGGFVVLTSARLAWSELSGVESTLAAALTLAALWSHLLQSYHGSDQRGSKRYVTGMLFAIGALARPEVALLFLITLVHWFVEHLSERKRANSSIAYEEFWRDARATVLGFFVILLPIVLTNQALADSFFPPALNAALGEHSLPMVVARGDVAELTKRLLQSWIALPHFLALFSADHPLFIITIPWAGILLIRRSAHSHMEQLFTLGILVLIFFPYFHALFLGIEHLPDSYALNTLFLTPIYLLTGIASLRIICERYVLRGPTNFMILTLCTTLLAATGILCIAFLATTRSNPYLWTGLFIALVGAAYLIALRHERSKGKGTRKYAHDPAEFDGVTFSVVSETEDIAEAYSKQTKKILHGVLIIALAWNLALLIPFARDYAQHVKANREGSLALAGLSAEITSPGSTIATDAIGAMGYLSERTIVDVEGRLPGVMLQLRRKSGEWQGLVEALRVTRPQYLALVDPRYSPFISLGESDRFLNVVNDSLTRRSKTKLFSIDYDRAETMRDDAAKLKRLAQ